MYDWAVPSRAVALHNSRLYQDVVAKREARAKPAGQGEAHKQEVFAEFMRILFDNEFPSHPDEKGEFPGWEEHWAIFQAGAALATPLPAQVQPEDDAALKVITRLLDENYHLRSSAAQVQPDPKLSAWMRVAMESGDWMPDADGMPRRSASKVAQVQPVSAEAVLAWLVETGADSLLIRNSPNWPGVFGDAKFKKTALVAALTPPKAPPDAKERKK